jgi:hypothetical protein
LRGSRGHRISVGFIHKDLLEAHLFNTTFSHSNVGTKAKLLRAFFFLKKKNMKKKKRKKY